MLLGPGYHAISYVNISLFHAFDQLTGRYHSRSLYSKQVNPIPLDSILNVTAGNRILIVGGPGAGKTRLTHRITELWTERKVLVGCDLYAFRLRWFIGEDNVKLKSVLSKYLLSPILDSVVKEAGSNNGKGMCFLLDGLDEYEAGYNDIGVHNFFYQLMHSQKLTKAVVIVTTRNITSSGFESIRWVRRYIIAEFSEKQLAEFFNLSGTDLMSLVPKHHNLWMMCRNPLHASLLVKAFSTRKLQLDLISTRTKLFETIVMMIFERDLEKSSEPRKYENMKDVKHLLTFSLVRNVCSLAFSGSLNIPRRHFFIDHEVPSELKWTNLSYFGIEPKPGASNMEVYSFTHPSLMDFLAALHLTTLSEDEQSRYIKQRGSIPGVEDVWIFFCGLADSVNSHIKTLRNTLLVIKVQYPFHCIFEAQTHSSKADVKSAAQYILNQSPEKGNLGIGPLHSTDYDWEAIHFVLSFSAHELNTLTASTITSVGTNYGVVSILIGLAKSKADCSLLKVINFADIHDVIKWDESSKNYVKEFFSRAPNLNFMVFHNVSESIAETALYFIPRERNLLHELWNGFNTSPETLWNVFNNFPEILWNVFNISPETLFNQDMLVFSYIKVNVVTPYTLLKSHPKLGYLLMEHCNITDKHLVDISQLPPIGLFGIQLSHNHIGDWGAIALAGSLSGCNTFHVKLSFNNIGVKGLLALLNAAKACSTFSLDLRGNAVKDRDVDKIIDTCNKQDSSGNGELFVVNLLDNPLTKAGHARLKKEIVSRCLFVSTGNNTFITSIDHLSYTHAVSQYNIYNALSEELTANTIGLRRLSESNARLLSSYES